MCVNDFKDIMNMKKYILPAMCLMLAACTKQAIDLAPKTSIPYEVAAGTAERCELTIIGCYDAAQSGLYPVGNARRGYPFGGASTEQGDMKGEDMMNVQSFFAVTYSGGYSTASPNGQAHWEGTYQMINKINIAIAGMEDALAAGVISQKKYDDAVGELKFLRALGFHEMLVFFAMPYAATPDASHHGIPVSIVPINTAALVEEAKAAGRATVKATYEQILSDLEAAEAGLPANSSEVASSAVNAGTTQTWRNSNNLISRASKASAIALKARVYQHMGQWDKVISESAKIIPASAPFVSPIGGRQLTATPEGPFANNGGNTESLFSIENSTTDNATVNGSISQMYWLRSLVCISPIIWNADWWLAGDLRRSQLTKVKNFGRVDALWTWKYRAEASMSDWTPILRYSEVLLTYAEALARTKGVDAQAVALLNAVRNRAVTDPAQQFTAASFANVEELMDAIIKERRIEFLAEGRRWPDIHRLTYDPKYAVKAPSGKAGVPARVEYSKLNTAHYNAASGVVDPAIMGFEGIDFDDRRYVFPIPQSETSSNPKLAEQQNPGW
jgi:hypothetical protein